ncbi:hypothetical protein D3C71_1862110 [compost metagenome]
MMSAPLSPSSFTARSSSRAAASGDCQGRVAKPAKRVGCVRAVSASLSLAARFSSMASAAGSNCGNPPYEITCMSIPAASMSARRATPISSPLRADSLGAMTCGRLRSATF